MTGEPMAASLRRFACVCNLLMAAAILAIAFASSPRALAQAPRAAPSAEKPAANAAPAASDLKGAPPAAGPQVNGQDVTNRLNEELGIDLQATATGWQHELDHIEGDLSRPRLRYSDLSQAVKIRVAQARPAKIAFDVVQFVLPTGRGCLEIDPEFFIEPVGDVLAVDLRASCRRRAFEVARGRGSVCGGLFSGRCCSGCLRQGARAACKGDSENRRSHQKVANTRKSPQ